VYDASCVDSVLQLIPFAVTRFASEISKLHLMESFCLPVLSYGCEVMYLSIRQLNQLNIKCWNGGMCRKVFRLNQWESVTEVQWFCERLDSKNIVEKRKLIFVCVAKASNIMLQTCCTLCIYVFT